MLNDKPLTYSLLRVAQQKFGNTPSELSSEQLQEAETIARRKLDIENAVLSSTIASNVVIADQQVQAALNGIRSELSTETENDLEALLGKLDLSPDELEAAIARELRVEAVMDRICASLEPVTETEARLYYYMNPERFLRPEMRTARHILITINSDFPENQRDVALKRITDISDRLQKKPERFAEQAMKHSECPTSLQGGLMGKVMRGRVYPELESVLFSLQPGEISDVVESPLGFHLLLCDGIEPEATMELESVLPRLREKLEQQQRERHQKRWIGDLLRARAAEKSSINTEGRLANG